ncbi:MAG: flagellar basal-body MS-ring/collar protein FliF [Acidimicrobiales bacterium]
MALLPATDMARIREGARRFASGFTAGQKAVTAAALVAVVAAAAIFMSISGRPTYSPLFTNLTPSDAAAITQKLATDHVPYQLENGGTTILVPENEVDQERLAAAQAGLPTQSTVGLSILDKEGLTTSQLTQQADYLQALQGELEQTIDAISGVSSSQVNIALPATQTFALGNSNPTGASVLVSLQPGVTLSSGEVQAIVHLVSSSVPGLSAGNVTVADSSGNLLAGPGVSATADANGQTSAYDAAQQQRVLAYLTSVLGPSNADVQVNAQLDFNQVETNSQSLVPNPNGTQPSFCTSNQQSSTNYSGTGAPPGGVAGTNTATGTGGNGTYSQTSSNTTCETNTKTQRVVQAPGTVTQQSVAVLVNSKAMPKGLSLLSLEKGIAAAADVQTARGDTLSVNEAPFIKQATVATTKASMTSMLSKFGKPLLAVLLVLLVLFLFRRAAKKARTAQPAVADGLLSTLALPSVHGDDPTDQVFSLPPRTAHERLTAGIDTIIDDQPDEVAKVLRDWLQRKAPAQLEHRP